ncbi:hypothetical protein SC09_contig10orf00026 [Bacillus subtilis]|uniref:Uncharacterized protein n=1 Tax=Bacillus subtilis TaxID=1423 RepID=A0A0D1KUC6_BACIU|nr:hypothetical protein SC09_contig10orf00026 [Bacillus subtilis]
MINEMARWIRKELKTMNKIRADLNIESEILLQIKAEGKHLSRSVSLMDPSEENYIETVGSVYFINFMMQKARWNG